MSANKMSPIVLAINCGETSLPQIMEEMGLPTNTRHIHDIFRDFPYLLNIDNINEWWVDPQLYDAMVYLTFTVFQERRTPKYIRQWTETEAFEKKVQGIIIEVVERNLHSLMSFEDLPSREEWMTAVRLVVLNGTLVPNSLYVQRVFKDLFPDARYAAWYGPHAQGARLKPIWRDTGVTPIEEGRKPTMNEVLDWPASQLPGLPEDFQTWGTTFDAKVEHLVGTTPEHLAGFGHRKSVIDQIQEALKPYGLRLGMTEEDIQRVREDDAQRLRVEKLRAVGGWDGT